MSDDAKAPLSPTEAPESGFRKAVIASVVAAVVVLVVVQPLLNFLWRFVFSNFQAIGDKACRMAALDYTDRYSFLMEGWFFSCFIGLGFGLLVIAYSRILARRGRAEDAVPKWLNLPSRLVSSRVAMTVLFILSIIGATYATARDFMAMQLKASFHQRLAVLAPKISEQEYKELLASWANMQTQEDYRQIVKNMEAEAQRAGVWLPNLLPGARP